jgi:hypothetical protein
MQQSRRHFLCVSEQQPASTHLGSVRGRGNQESGGGVVFHQAARVKAEVSENLGGVPWILACKLRGVPKGTLSNSRFFRTERIGSGCSSPETGVFVSRP